MNTDNTMEIKEFVFYQAVSFVIFWVLYKIFVFRSLRGYSLRESRLILFGVILICCGLGMLLEMKKERNGISILVNLLWGFGLYTVFAYDPVRRKLVRTAILAAAVLAVAYAIFILCHKIWNRTKFRQILLRRVIRAVKAGRNLFCAGFTVIMLSIVGHEVFGSASITPATAPATRSNIDEQTIENNMDTLVLLQEERWSALSAEEKLNVLQTVANIEQRYLGLPNELNVGALRMSDSTGGYYNETTHQIIVNEDRLFTDTAYELVRTIAHEAYHSFQFRVIDAYEEASDDLKKLWLYRDARVYKEEFADYNSNTSDFYGYYTQECEADAREYARDSALEYFERMLKYVKDASRAESGGHVPDPLSAADAESTSAKESQASMPDSFSAADAGRTSTAESQAPVPDSFSAADPGSTPITETGESADTAEYSFVESARWATDGIVRYVGANGLIGYMDISGKEITPPIYVYGSEMFCEIAMVSEGAGGVYYIDSAGQRLTQNYMDGYTFDVNWCIARVKTDDGKWALIDTEGEFLFQGADRIEEIPSLWDITTAVIDGHAAMLKLPAGADRWFCEVLCTFPDFTEISPLIGRSCAKVWNSEGKTGLVACDGTIIVPAEYDSISCERIYCDEDFRPDLLLFRLTKPDGSTESVTLEI